MALIKADMVVKSGVLSAVKALNIIFSRQAFIIIRDDIIPRE